MISRTPEPEVMDEISEAAEYDAMDHSVVNAAFVSDFLSSHGDRSLPRVLDVGTGTALIPIQLVGAVRSVNVDACDRSIAMLKIADDNIRAAGFANLIRPIVVDSRTLPFADGCFDAVISNSLVHHLPPADGVSDPIGLSIGEMSRVLKPGGTLFLRDLCRPKSADSVERIVSEYAGGETEFAKQLFRQSLHAALNADEVSAIFRAITDIIDLSVTMTSDRHWTACGFKIDA